MADDSPKISLINKAVCLFVYGFYRLVEGVCRVLPLTWVFTIGRGLGWLISFCLPKYFTLVRRNITIAFGREMTRKEIRQLSRKHFSTLGGNILSSFKIPWMTLESLDDCVEWAGLDEVEKTVGKGCGIIYALLHMGNWEILSQMERITAGAKPSTMFQRLANPYLNAHVARLRARTGCALFDRRDGFFGPMKWLKEGGAIGILGDQHAGDAGVWSPLFDRLASTTNLIQLLSLRSKAPIHPVSVETIGRARWKVSVLPPIPFTKDVDLGAALMNVALEKIIRQSPADWFWVHNRWKTPRPNFLLQEYKRGVVLPPGYTMETLQPFEILIRSTNWLGDACMAFPAVRAIRRGRPDARVTILTPAKLADLWRLLPEVDEVLEIPADSSVFKVRKLVKATGKRFDVAILLPNSLRTALEVRVDNVISIVGYKGHWRRKLLHQIVPPPKQIGPVKHHSQHYLRMAARMGGNIKDPTLFDAIPFEDVNQLASLRLGLCPGAEYGGAKRWPVERYAAAAKEIAEQTNCEWVIFGAKGDIPIAEELTNLMDGRCLNLAGKTSLTQLCAELRRCKLLLTNDTGTMHLAAALGVPTVSIFGSTEPNWTGPLGQNHTVLRRHVECSPCFKRECPIDFRCMKEIEPEHVAAAVIGSLQELVG